MLLQPLEGGLLFHTVFRGQGLSTVEHLCAGRRTHQWNRFCQIGLPRVTDRNGFQRRFEGSLERLDRGEISHSQAARELRTGYATLKRLLDQQDPPTLEGAA